MLTKQKKRPQDKDHPSRICPQSQRLPLQPRTSLASTRKKDQPSNKENLVQITEPLDIALPTSNSKQFILSRESLNGHSRTQLQDISNTTHPSQTLPSKEHSASKRPYTQQELFDRRLSLKCTTNYSQLVDNQKSHRLSMAPLRRESFSTQLAPPHEQKDSVASYQPSLFSSQSKSRPTPKKQTIITNLMHKLDHEQDLRSIIELKLKSSSTQLPRDKRNQSYIEFNDEHAQNAMAHKLKQCERQICHFKDVIKDMSEKLTSCNKFAKKTHTQIEHSVENSRLTHNRKFGEGCQKCQNCSCRMLPEPKRLESQRNVNQSLDFLDNLECTLKVLERKHV